MKRIFFLLLLFLGFGVKTTLAQFVLNGTDPTGTQWLQLKSDHYTLIYPSEVDSLARIYLSLLEESRNDVMQPLRIQPRRIPVILHPYNCMSNGMVTWAPRRMELYSTPPTSGHPENWEHQLAVHESRHVGQVSHLEQGIWKYLGYGIGEQATGVGLGIYVAKWFLEGDAVVAETARSLSHSGRGRHAEFSQYLRTAYLNGDYRNWSRYLHGSYRHYTPNHYVIGYYQTAFQTWLDRQISYPGNYLTNLVENWYRFNLIFPDNRALLAANQTWLTEQWQKDLEERGPLSEPAHLPHRKNRLYTNYKNVGLIPADEDEPVQYYAVKTSMERSARLIRIDHNGKERLLMHFSPYADKISQDSTLLYWSEIIPDWRWEQRNWSDLYRYDMKTGKKTRLTHRGRYFNPAPTPEGLVAIEYPVSGSSFTVWIDSTGTVQSRIEAPEKGQIREVCCLNGTVYATVIVTEGIGLYHWNGQTWICDLQPQGQTLQELNGHDGQLFFTSDINGVLNLYSFDPATGTVLRQTEARYGAAYPQPTSEGLLYADYTHKGYRPAWLDRKDWVQEPQDMNQPYTDSLANFLSEQYASAMDQPVYNRNRFADATQYPAEKYSKLGNLFRFHSWAPVYYNIDRIQNMSYEKLYDLAALGLTAYSQNNLGTAVTMLGYSYHEGFHAGHVNFTYSGWWPVVEISADFNDRTRVEYDLQQNPIQGRVSTRKSTPMPLLQTKARMYLPINLSRNGWYSGLIPQISYNFSNDRFQFLDLPVKYRHQLSYGLSYYRHLYPATSAIYPRWGFGINLAYGHTVGAEPLFGETVYAKAYAYLPGILSTQGLKLSASAQLQLVSDDNWFLFGSFASLPRGFKLSNIPTGPYLMATADYALPIYLGDINVTPLFYLKRLQLIPFCDAAWTKNKDSWTRLLSYGADALIDFHLLEFSLPFSAGVRYARLHTNAGSIKNPNTFQFLFNFSW